MINITPYDYGIIGVAIAAIISLFTKKKEISISLLLVLFLLILIKFLS
ncbi:hypothetical protein J4433_01745 [Candidatus Pacearchaeota archaeon]|nr:hypothetical protein [Candidatus Pacearchaeota archaeon]